jgi:hypothetical protein
MHRWNARGKRIKKKFDLHEIIQSGMNGKGLELDG